MTALATRLSVDSDSPSVAFNDGIVGAWGPQNAFLVTSPNMKYIPEIVQGIVSVYLRENGGFGLPDPLLWPQVYTSKHPYLAAIPKARKLDARNPPSPCHPRSAIWASPSSHDFVYLPNTPVRGFGHWSAQFLSTLEAAVNPMSSRALQYIRSHLTIDTTPLRQYEQQMTMTWLRLCHASATYRDQCVQLATVQRNWSLCSAFMTFYDLASRPPSSDPLPVDVGLMGAWTSEPNEVQNLLSLGIPVWWVRVSHVIPSNVRVGRWVPMVHATQVSHPIVGSNTPIYQGLAGPRHLEVTFSIPSYLDMARMPTSYVTHPDEYRAIARRQAPLANLRHVSPAPSSPPSGAKVTAKRSTRLQASRRPSPYSIQELKGSKVNNPSQGRGRDKFHDPPHPWMPPSLTSWDRAMRTVDRSRQGKTTEDMWGYWIPEPALILGGKDPVRQHRYLLNWLRAQPVWLYMLQVPGAGACRVPPQSWRDFLYGVPDDPSSVTRVGKRAFQIRQIFGRVFEEAELDGDVDGEVVWHDHRFASISDEIAPLIVWETFELGFRYELWALDRFIRPITSPTHEAERTLAVARVFPANSLWTVPSIPTADACGLFAALPQRRVNALNALRDVLAGWPRCPQVILDASPLQIADTEDVIENLESLMASFYVNTFFEYSARAPIVPHCFPRSSGAL